MKKKNIGLHVMKKEEEKPTITPDTFPKQLRPPVLAGLPQYLKDHEVYKKVRAELFGILRSTCSHREDDLLEWSTCVKCQIKVRDHAEFLRKLGFTSPAQYYAWRRVHEAIDNPKRIPINPKGLLA